MKLNLPDKIKRTAFFSGPSFKDGEEILFKYCSSCAKHSRCKKNEILNYAMADNFPFWSNDFVAVTVPKGDDYFFRSETHVMCRTYQDRQMKLKGMSNFIWADPVRRLIDITETLRAEEA